MLWLPVNAASPQVPHASSSPALIAKVQERLALLLPQSLAGKPDVEAVAAKP
jgi:hypothetical protein